MNRGRSRKGAWIEIVLKTKPALNKSVAPVRERGLKSDISRKPTKAQNSRSRKGAWIEIMSNKTTAILTFVAPVRERGLK